MNRKISRRTLLGSMGSAGMAVGLGAAAFSRGASADPPVAAAPEAFGEIHSGTHVSGPTGHAAGIVDGKIIQPQRELTLLHETDVLIVGGGPAGVAAAIAARRSGASATLVERYGHFGGLWTGGLVLTVVGHWVAGPKQVCQGIGEEMLHRLDKLDRGIVDRRPGVDPTVDAEALKYVMVEMIMEAGVDVFLHCTGVDAIMDGQTIQGAVFESKSGRQAILAKVVIDATGDGDVFAAAGAEHDRMLHHTGLPCRIGNLDKVDKKKAATAPPPKRLGLKTPIEGVNWINMAGPDCDSLDVHTLTKLELDHRRHIWKHVEKIRKTPGYEKVYLMETAPQLGVRITRVLRGVETLTMQNVKDDKHFSNVVAVGGSWSDLHEEWQVPYGALLPKKIDNLLASGRCISAEARVLDVTRPIPNCLVIGHAAGCAAAMAARDGCLVRDVEIPKLQQLLRSQDAYLG